MVAFHCGIKIFIQVSVVQHKITDPSSRLALVLLCGVSQMEQDIRSLYRNSIISVDGGEQ